MVEGEPKKLFKYYLDQAIQDRNSRPLFFRRTMRWRVNAKEYGYPLSKKGMLRGYIKYGVFAYLSWHFFKVAITPSEHHGTHGSHGHGDEVAHVHGEHGHQEKKHH